MFWSVEEVVGKKEERRKIEKKKSKGMCVEEKKRGKKRVKKIRMKIKKRKKGKNKINNKKLKLRNIITIFLQYFQNKS